MDLLIIENDDGNLLKWTAMDSAEEYDGRSSVAISCLSAIFQVSFMLCIGSVLPSGAYCIRLLYYRIPPPGNPSRARRGGDSESDSDFGG
uniref:UBC core domain-containing protein n=1 Tax=Steinernema glaseri TaxID=37863 RepID=A0A1I7ZDS3_9BILA